MPTFRTAEVVEILSARPGLQRVRVAFVAEPGDAGSSGADAVEAASDRAYALTELVGDVAVGDRVVLNTTAVELGLGTGGWHVVHWNLARSTVVAPGPGHVMKLRYTSLQVDAGTSELDHPTPGESLEGIPVVVCQVHSQLPVVAAAFARSAPDARLAHVMTDGGALPIALSDHVATLRDRGLLATTVTAGHAFGGELESVTVASGLLLARHAAHADAIVVAMGPGVVGTGTTYGTTAIEAAAVLDAVAHLGGVPVLCPRISDADPRPRHRGLSHHTTTAAAMTGARPWVASIPPEAASLPGVRVATVEPLDVAELLDAAGLTVTTMGRTVHDDPRFFEASAAAGTLAASLIPRTEAAGGATGTA